MCSNCVRNNNASSKCGCNNTTNGCNCANNVFAANANGCGCTNNDVLGNNGCGCCCNTVLTSAANGAASTVFRIVRGFDRSISCGGCGCNG